MRYTLITLITAAFLSILAGCSQPADPPDPTSIHIATRVAQAPEPTRPPTEPPPTKPQRIENIIPLATLAAQRKIFPPTVEAPASEPQTSTKTTEPGPAPSAQPAETIQPRTPNSFAIPSHPQFTDEVLLQDLYENIDLDRFALPDDYQIPPDYDGRIIKKWSPSGNDSFSNKFSFHDTTQHPYLHVFPGLEHNAKEHAAALMAVKKNPNRPMIRDKENFVYIYRDIEQRSPSVT